MIDYDRASWWGTCFSFHGSVLPQVLGRVGLLTGLSLGLYFLQEFVLKPVQVPFPSLDPLGHTVLGLTLGQLIVFRTNSSSNRYWEARTLWGQLVNNSRSLARLAQTYASPADDLARLIVAYVMALKQNLRGDPDLGDLRTLIPGRLFDQTAAAGNPPSVMAMAVSGWIQKRRTDGKIDSITAMEMEAILSRMVDAQGGCERILKTPLPFVYAALIKQSLLLYLGSLPFVLVTKMDWAAPIVVAVVSLGMLGIEEAGVEIENPFAHALNDLPLEKICETIARDVAMLTERREN